jgi:O-antigen ligase
MSSNNDIEGAKNFKPTEARGLAFVVGFYFSFRIVLVLLSVRVLGTEPRTGAAISLALNLLLLLLVCFHSLGYANRTFGSMLRLSSMRWVLVFLVVSCCSLAWSGTASLATSSAYWCGMAADVAIVVLLLRAGSVTGVSHSLMKGFIVSACCIALIAWIMPAQSDLRLGDEELLGPNQIGYLCAFAFFFAQYLMRMKSGKWGAPALLLAVTLLRTLSKTTIVAFLVSEGFLLLRDRSMSRRTKILVALAATAAVAAFWGLLASYYDVYTNAGNQSETLSGRLGIWAYFLAEAVQQPWIGHGFDSAWKVVPPFGPDQFEAAHAHNELLQQFYGYGLVGIFIFIGIYSSIYRHIRRIAAGPVRTFFLAFLLFVLVRGTADTERFDLSLPLWAIVLVSLLVEHAIAMDADARAASFAMQFNVPRTLQPLSIMECFDAVPQSEV